MLVCVLRDFAVCIFFSFCSLRDLTVCLCSGWVCVLCVVCACVWLCGLCNFLFCTLWFAYVCFSCPVCLFLFVGLWLLDVCEWEWMCFCAVCVIVYESLFLETTCGSCIGGGLCRAWFGRFYFAAFYWYSKSDMICARIWGVLFRFIVISFPSTGVQHSRCKLTVVCIRAS